MKKPAATIIAGLVLAPLALGPLEGCAYVRDAIGRDARQAAIIPEATVRGTKADLDQYRTVKDDELQGGSRPAIEPGPTAPAGGAPPPPAEKR